MVIGTTDEKKLAVFPNAVTFKEAGYPEVESLSWYGLFGPKGMPDAVVQKILDGLIKATQDPAIAKQLDEQGAIVILNKPAEFKTFLDKETVKWTEVAKNGNIQVQ